MKDLGYQKALIQDWDALNSLKESITVFLEFIDMGESVEEELSEETEKFLTQLEALELKELNIIEQLLKIIWFLLKIIEYFKDSGSSFAIPHFRYF